MENFKWDVTIEQSKKDFENKDIYFDPDLSYEITGYIPINETSGLDFNPEWFMEAGKAKTATGKYCESPQGSMPFTEFWKDQIEKITYGMTCNGYRVTGDHYFFLNYHPLLSGSADEDKQAGMGRETNLPSFWVEHYKYSHYLDMAEKFKLDVCLLKSRGVGMSEFAAACGERMYTVIRKSKCIYTAYMENYLLSDGVVQKIWNVLEYLNQETDGGLRHVRLGKNSELHKRASVKNKQGEESGFMSEILGIIADNPRKIRGTRVDRLFYEEAGSFKDLGRAWTQGTALVEINGIKHGTKIAWGTGGDAGPNLIGLEKLFLEPKANNILPYKHRNNPEGDEVFTGYFIPSFATVVPLMDKRGYVDPEKGKEHYENKRNSLKTADNMQNYFDNCSEYCFYPEEALQKQGENEFDQEALTEQYANVAILKKYDKPEIGRLTPIYDHDGKAIIDVNWVPDDKGDIIIIEHPVLEGGMVVKNLYCSGIDGIDHGVDDSVVKSDGSKFAIAIKKRTYGIGQGDKYVAFYLKRPKDVREAYMNALKLLIYYKCKANLEDTKIGFRTWLRDTIKNEERFLMKRPNYALPDGRKKVNTLWGTPGSEKNIRHGLELIDQFIRDNVTTLTWIPCIEQLKKFSYDAKGRFDIVMAMVYAEIADEDMYGHKIKSEKDTMASNWNKKKIGMYTDENGNKRWGARSIVKEGPKVSVDFYNDIILK